MGALRLGFATCGIADLSVAACWEISALGGRPTFGAWARGLDWLSVVSLAGWFSLWPGPRAGLLLAAALVCKALPAAGGVWGQKSNIFTEKNWEILKRIKTKRRTHITCNLTTEWRLVRFLWSCVFSKLEKKYYIHYSQLTASLNVMVYFSKLLKTCFFSNCCYMGVTWFTRRTHFPSDRTHRRTYPCLWIVVHMADPFPSAGFLGQRV